MIRRIILHWLTDWLDRPWFELSQEDLPGEDLSPTIPKRWAHRRLRPCSVVRGCDGLGPSVEHIPWCVDVGTCFGVVAKSDFRLGHVAMNPGPNPCDAGG
jgi:hypothetical protein